MQRIFITGANRGLGLEIVRQYLQNDDTQIFATCRQPESATELNSLTEDYPERLAILGVQLTDPPSIASSVRQVSEQVTGLDIFINNAGMNPGRDLQSLNTITPQTMLEVFEVNSVAPLMLVNAYVELLKAGTNPRIINVSSQVGSMEWKVSGGSYAYAASKAVLNMITRCLAADLKHDGITTVCVHPGWVQTDMGGNNAPLTAEEAVFSLLRVIDNLTIKDNGTFLKWTGAPHPW